MGADVGYLQLGSGQCGEYPLSLHRYSTRRVCLGHEESGQSLDGQEDRGYRDPS